MQRRYAAEQVKNCYPAFTEQFDVLRDDQVIWEPYTYAAIARRYPRGISLMCTRDEAYWMTKSKIIYDIEVEVISQQRIMRQFGLRQLEEPPRPDRTLPDDIHRYVKPFTDFHMGP